MYVCVCDLLSHVRLFANPWTVAHQVPLSMEFPRQEYWSGLPFPSLGDLPYPGIKSWVFCITGRLYHLSHLGSPLDILCVCVLVTRSCPTLCKPMDCSPPGSSVHGIPQARILEWVTIPFSRESSQPRDRTWVSHTAGRFFTI